MKIIDESPEVQQIIAAWEKLRVSLDAEYIEEHLKMLDEWKRRRTRR